MPTIAGMRRLGFTPESLRRFAERVGVSKSKSVIDISLLEHTLREDLNARCPRYMGVLRPIELVIENFEEGRVESVTAQLHPEDASQGARDVPLTRTVWVERDDYMDDPPRKWHRLGIGREVRLRYGCLVTVTGADKDASGHVVRLRATWDPGSLGGDAPDGRKVRGTIHWVSAAHAIDAEVRLYDRLFRVPDPMDVPEGRTFLDHMNRESLEVVPAKLEPSLADPKLGTRVQLERLGYFICDPDTKPGAPVWNRTITLRDSWAKMAQKLAD